MSQFSFHGLLLIACAILPWCGSVVHADILFAEACDVVVGVDDWRVSMPGNAIARDVARVGGDGGENADDLWGLLAGQMTAEALATGGDGVEERFSAPFRSSEWFLEGEEEAMTLSYGVEDLKLMIPEPGEWVMVGVSLLLTFGWLFLRESRSVAV